MAHGTLEETLRARWPEKTLTDRDFVARICSCLEHPPSEDEWVDPPCHDTFIDSVLLTIRAEGFEPVKDITEYRQLLYKCVEHEKHITKDEAKACIEGKPFHNAIHPLACLAAESGDYISFQACLDAGLTFDKVSPPVSGRDIDLDGNLRAACNRGLENVGMFNLLYKIDYENMRTAPERLQDLTERWAFGPLEVLLACFRKGAEASTYCIKNAETSEDAEERLRLMFEDGQGAKHIAGSGALQRAAQKGHLEVMRLLLDAGSDIDEIPSETDFRVMDPNQALFDAVKHDQKEAAMLLLERGSRPDVDHGMWYGTKPGTAIDCAKEKGDDEMVAILEAALQALGPDPSPREAPERPSKKWFPPASVRKDPSPSELVDDEAGNAAPNRSA